MAPNPCAPNSLRTLSALRHAVIKSNVGISWDVSLLYRTTETKSFQAACRSNKAMKQRNVLLPSKRLSVPIHECVLQKLKAC